MLEEARKLTRYARRIEHLLGFQLNITKDLIESIVANNVEKQIRKHGIRVLTLDVNRVNWNQLMLDAVYRRPPLSPGDKEKDFRDALIAETFLQLVSSSRATWIAFVTQDKLLTDSVSARTQGLARVRVIQSIEALESF